MRFVAPQAAMAGPFLAMAWAVVPEGFVESMAYSESLFTALCAWALLYGLKKRWVGAGLFCLAAGLTRLTSPALIAPVMIACVVALVRARGRGWRAWIGLAVAPLGWLGFVGWVGARLGRLTGYMDVQLVNWAHGDGRRDTLVRDFGAMLRQENQLALWVTTAFMVFTVVMIIFLVLDRRPWILIVFAALTLVGSVASIDFGQFWVLSRYAVPNFPVLIPVAVGLAAIRRAKAWILLACLVGFAAYFAVYMALVFPAWP
jgi:hypothetical protein